MTNAKTQRRSKARQPGRSLTPRQYEVLRLVCQGMTSREIADSLAIAVQTVDVHRHNLMRRLEVHNTAQLFRKAVTERYV